jgi:hypothetical protein
VGRSPSGADLAAGVAFMVLSPEKVHAA